MEIAKQRHGTDSEEAYQARILQGVSRTFALTIPTLPPELCRVVGNAYLLCRIADTIEDEVALSPEQKQYFSDLFTEVLAGDAPATRFSVELVPLLSNQTLGAERELIENTPRVVAITQSFSESARNSLRRCVRIMSQGMSEFAQNKSLGGLRDLQQLDRYCYHVAGVVGEMLTELFCEHCEETRERREALLALSVSFGQGLQMTNILKDVWEDRGRGACWLPRDVFNRAGFDLLELSEVHHGEDFAEGMTELIGIAQIHLRNALDYTLLIPRRERGIRRFCLWALGMAVLTLRKIHSRLDFTSGKQVKISRGSVKSTVLITNFSAGSDTSLRLLFDLFTRGLPAPSGLTGIAPGS